MTARTVRKDKVIHKRVSLPEIYIYLMLSKGYKGNKPRPLYLNLKTIFMLPYSWSFSIRVGRNRPIFFSPHKGYCITTKLHKKKKNKVAIYLHTIHSNMCHTFGYQIWCVMCIFYSNCTVRILFLFRAKHIHNLATSLPFLITPKNFDIYLEL